MCVLFVCCSKVVRKGIARVLTVVNQNQRAALKDAYKGKVRKYYIQLSKSSSSSSLDLYSLVPAGL